MSDAPEFKVGDRVWYETGNNDLLGTVEKVTPDGFAFVRFDIGGVLDGPLRVSWLKRDTSGEAQR